MRSHRPHRPHRSPSPTQRSHRLTRLTRHGVDRHHRQPPPTLAPNNPQLSLSPPTHFPRTERSSRPGRDSALAVFWCRQGRAKPQARPIPTVSARIPNHGKRRVWCQPRQMSPRSMHRNLWEHRGRQTGVDPFLVMTVCRPPFQPKPPRCAWRAVPPGAVPSHAESSLRGQAATSNASRPEGSAFRF